LQASQPYTPLKALANEVSIGDTTYDVVHAFMEYIYSDHASIENTDPVALLQLSNQYDAPRLLSLCELAVSKMVEVATKDGIEKADIDIIGLLLLAQQNNANQLAAFCLHFIANNYQVLILGFLMLKYVQHN